MGEHQGHLYDPGPAGPAEPQSSSSSSSPTDEASALDLNLQVISCGLVTFLTIPIRAEEIGAGLRGHGWEVWREMGGGGGQHQEIVLAVSVISVLSVVSLIFINT